MSDGWKAATYVAALIVVGGILTLAAPVLGWWAVVMLCVWVFASTVYFVGFWITF